MKHITFLIVGLLLFSSCSKKQTDKDVSQEKEINLKKSNTDEKVVTAKFSWFELKDDIPYSIEFEKETGESIYFEDIDINNFDFVEKLNESETSEFNKGWGINYDLHEKWFKITYTSKNEPKKLNDSISLFIIKNIAEDTTIRKVKEYDYKKDTLTIIAKFKEFRLGDTEHYNFENETGEIITFQGCKIDNFEFGIELNDSEANSENQGWGSNNQLQNKWFTLSFVNEERPLYVDGPMGNVKIITKAVLKTK